MHKYIFLLFFYLYSVLCLTEQSLSVVYNTDTIPFSYLHNLHSQWIEEPNFRSLPTYFQSETKQFLSECETRSQSYDLYILSYKELRRFDYLYINLTIIEDLYHLVKWERTIIRANQWVDLKLPIEAK